MMQSSVKESLTCTTANGSTIPPSYTPSIVV
jgi:hypothetical protein